MTYELDFKKIRLFTAVLLAAAWIFVIITRSDWEIQPVTEFAVSAVPYAERDVLPDIGTWVPESDEAAQRVLKAVHFDTFDFKNWGCIFVRGQKLHEDQSSSSHLTVKGDLAASPEKEDTVYCYRYPRSYHKRIGVGYQQALWPERR